MKQDILNLQVEERIRNLGPWNEDAPLYHCMHLAEKGNSLNTYTIISLPRSDIEKNLSAIQGSHIRVTHCIPHVASISALTGRLTHEPVMACFLAMGYLEILVAEKGIPYYSQISPLEHGLGLDLEILAQAIFNVRQIISTRYNKRVGKLLFFTKENVQVPEKIGDEEVWRPELKGLIPPESEPLFWKYPELIGAPFVSRDFDCLPKQLKTTYIFEDLNKAVAGLAATGLVFLGASAFFLTAEHSRALARYNRLYSVTQTKKEKIVARIPESHEVQNLSRIARVWKSMNEEKPVEQLLYSVARHIPENVIIHEMSIKRQGSQNEPNNSREIPPPEQFTNPQETNTKTETTAHAFYQRPLIVHLDLVTTGSFQEVKTRLQRAAHQLGRGFVVSNVTMKYQEEKGLGNLTCDLLKREVSGG